MTQLDRVQECRAKNPIWGRHRIAKELNIPPATVQRYLQKLGAAPGQPHQSCDNASAPLPTQESFKQESTNDGGSCFTSVSSDITNLEELLNYAKVDRAVWEVERWIANKWEMAAKMPDGKLVSKPLFQVKAWLRQRKQVVLAREALEGVLAKLKEAGPTFARRRGTPDSGNLLELSIFDLHFGKLCWGDETGQNYDSKIAETTFIRATEQLLDRTKGTNFARILFPVGNDFFNVDNAAATTTAGTPQSEDGRWQKSFVAGRAAMVRAIEMLRQVAPVSVVMVSGNHDYERVFYLGDVLQAWFHKTPDVTIDNAPTQRKYFRFQKCLIGLTHGNNEKHTNLPLIMATEKPHDWAETKFREFHLGHWHQKKELHFQPVFEQNGIRVRIIPSLCPPDAWHKSKGYEGLRAAEAYIWNGEQGCVGQFSYFPE